MANFTTTDDLREDALFLAGENPADTTGDYFARAFAYLNAAQNALTVGGPLGTGNLPVIDWWFLRAFPRGVLSLLPPVNSDHAVSAIFTQGSTAVILSPSVTTDLTTYRLRVEGAPQLPYVAAHLGTDATLATPWLGDTVTTAAWTAYLVDYPMPADFVRFASPFYDLNGCEVSVIDPRELEREHPITNLGLYTNALPSRAALVAEKRVRFSTSVEALTTVEYEYVRQPDVLIAGSTPIVPYPHRRVLSLGAGYLIALDKADRAKADELYGQFMAAWNTMAGEHRRQWSRGSAVYGVPIPRRTQRTPRWIERTY